jgi:hypothetical protein
LIKVKLINIQIEIVYKSIKTLKCSIREKVSIEDKVRQKIGMQEDSIHQNQKNIYNLVQMYTLIAHKNKDIYPKYIDIVLHVNKQFSMPTFKDIN